MPSSRYYRFKIADKKEKRKKIKFWFFCFLYLTIFSALVWLSFLSPLFEIQRVVSADNDYLNEETVEKIIAEIAPFGLYKNLLILPKSILKEKLAAAFPAVTDIVVEKNFFHALRINFKKRIPVGVWCAADCYFFDKDGVAFLEVPQTEGNLVLKIEDESKTSVALGNKILDGDQINFIYEFSGKINESDNGFKILKFKIKPEPTINLEAVTDKNWVIYLDEKRDPETAIGDLLTIIKESVKNADDLDYVDLRIPGRVFYKLH